MAGLSQTNGKGLVDTLMAGFRPPYETGFVDAQVVG